MRHCRPSWAIISICKLPAWGCIHSSMFYHRFRKLVRTQGRTAHRNDSQVASSRPADRFPVLRTPRYRKDLEN